MFCFFNVSLTRLDIGHVGLLCAYICAFEYFANSLNCQHLSSLLAVSPFSPMFLKMCQPLLLLGKNVTLTKCFRFNVTLSHIGSSAVIPEKIKAKLKMPSNVEIKAAVHNMQHLMQRAKDLSESDGTIIRQQDTFFTVEKGRLKLRDFMDGKGQLIFYERPDMDGPKLSNYSISPTADPEGLTKVLTDALGMVGQVKKERKLFMVGQTRVHVDTVEGLGHFMELEVVMKEGQSTEEGVSIAHKLMEELGVKKEDLIEGAYMDLLLAKQKTQNGHK